MAKWWQSEQVFTTILSKARVMINYIDSVRHTRPIGVSPLIKGNPHLPHYTFPLSFISSFMGLLMDALIGSSTSPLVVSMRWLYSFRFFLETLFSSAVAPYSGHCSIYFSLSASEIVSFKLTILPRGEGEPVNRDSLYQLFARLDDWLHSKTSLSISSTRPGGLVEQSRKLASREILRDTFFIVSVNRACVSFKSRDSTTPAPFKRR